jgi:hypothetical protein
MSDDLAGDCRTDQRRATFRAAMGDVLKIVGCGTVSKPRGFDACKHHPKSMLVACRKTDGDHDHRARAGPSQSICCDACGPGQREGAKRARPQRTLSR